MRCFTYADEDTVVFSGHSFMEQAESSLRGRRGSPQRQPESLQFSESLAVVLKTDGGQLLGNFNITDDFTRAYTYVPFKLSLSLNKDVVPLASSTPLLIEVVRGMTTTGLGLLSPASCRVLQGGRGDAPIDRPPWLHRLLDTRPETVGLVANSGVVLPPFPSLQPPMGEDRLLSLMLYHAEYHTGCLGVAWYLVYVRRSHWARLRERLPVLARGSDVLQRMQFVIWEDVTHDPQHPWASQVLTYNHALLALENDAQHVLFIDIDEYLVSKTPFGELATELVHGRLVLPRVFTACSGDDGKFPPLGADVGLREHRLGLLPTCTSAWSTHNQWHTPKMLIKSSPGVVGMAVHNVRIQKRHISASTRQCFRGSTCDLSPPKGKPEDPHQLYLLHAAGLVHLRYEEDPTSTDYLGSVDLTAPFKEAAAMCGLSPAENLRDVGGVTL